MPSPEAGGAPPNMFEVVVEACPKSGEDFEEALFSLLLLPNKDVPPVMLPLPKRPGELGWPKSLGVLFDEVFASEPGFGAVELPKELGAWLV